MKQLPRFEVEGSVGVTREHKIQAATGKAYVEPALFDTGIRAGTVLLSGLRPSRKRIGGDRFARFRNSEPCQST